GGSWSYGQLRAAAERLARELRAAGVRPQEFVSIHAHRRASLIAAILAVLRAGAVFHVLDPAYPARRTVAILRRARPRAWLEIAGENPVPGEVEAWLAGRNLRLRRRVPADLEAVGRDAPAEKVTSHLSPSGGTPPPPVTARDAAYVAFTSGSTGEPQGVVGSHGSLSHFIPWYRHTYELEPGDRFSLLAGLAHDPLHRDLFIPLLIGASIHVPSRDDLALPGRLGRWMERQAITVAHLTPAMASVLAQPPADGGAVVLPALRYAVFLGDVLKRSTVEAVHALAPSAVLINSYGTTESQRAVSAWPIPPGAGSEIVPLGQGIADVQLLVLTPGGRLAGIGELGEIHVRSPHLACGYLDDEARTAQRFPVNPLTRGRPDDRLCVTGDRGRFLPDGGVAFAGRADRQVKIRGFRVEAREIEIALERHSGVHQAVVRPLADHQGQPRLVAYVVAVEPSRRPGGDELREYLRERLPDYMVPVRFLAIESVPLTPSRKIDEAALPAPDWQERDLPARYEAPRTAVERLLLEIWTRVLRIDDAGIHDNFFALGGDSLVVMQVVAEAERAGIELRPRQLFERQTVAELASAAGRGVAIRAEQGTVAGTAPLLPGQHWFFARMLERVRPSPHAFVMSGWVEVDRTLDAATVEAGLAELWRHHDALRLRFERDDGGWRQVYTRDPAPPLVRVDLSALAQQDRARALSAVPGLLAGGLHITRGPLVRYAWIDGGRRHRPRLLMLMHHLVGDVPSWGILRPDLENLCRRRRLGTKTTSLRYWSQRLAEYRNSEAFAGEVAFWESMPERGDCCWPDYRDPAATGHGRASLTLRPDETRKLLRGVGRRHAGAREILLTALVRACAETLGGSSLLVRITGHGRTPLDDEVDLSRTVGWLTSTVPTMLRIDPAAPLPAALDDVCVQLARIPSHIGFGVLRSSGDRYPELVEKMWRLSSGVLVAFNFHGRVPGPAKEESPFIPLAESPSPIYGLPGGSSILRILCGVGHSDQQLWMQWIYSRRFFRSSFVDRLVADYSEILTRFLALL
ncbi:MAG: amino acid adenylation domain-containing protein, partial [bacterium]|nr:amino acid adenylation domain-containing protein [bacterium]